MKAKVSLKMFVLSAALLIASFTASARNNDGQLIYNPIEENGMTVGQTVYKMDGNTLANYMKYNYKYDRKRSPQMGQQQGRMGKEFAYQLYL